MTKRKPEEQRGGGGGGREGKTKTKKAKKHSAAADADVGPPPKKTSTATNYVDGDCPEEAIPVPAWADGLPEFKNKEKVLILSSRGITHR